MTEGESARPESARPTRDVGRRDPLRGVLAELAVVTIAALSLAWWSLPRTPAAAPAETVPSVLEPPRPGQVELNVANDEDLQRVARSSDLRELLIEQAEFSPAGLRALADCPELYHLRLRQFEVDDAAAEILSELSQLRFLNLPQANLSDQGLARIAALPNLELLRFGSRRITDDGLAGLQQATRLKFLHLIDVPLTDRGLAALEKLPKLESLYLDGAQVSDAAVLRLLETLPELHLHLDQQHHDRDPKRADHAHP